jgi:dTDP-4-dehydrorhamnose 3,5-epimerase
MIKSSLKTNIEGVVFFDLPKFQDSRGWLTELFRSDCLESSNLPQMAYISQTLPGVVRGPHEHKYQSDLFCFIGPGDFELILWEKLYSGSYEERYTLGESKPTAVIVPPGVVHAYKNISAYPGIVFNAPNKLFAGPGRCYPIDEIRHENELNSDFIV